MEHVKNRFPTPVIGMSDVKALTFSLDTNAYASGDVLADMQEIANFVRAEGGRVVVQNLTVLDKDGEGAELDILISPNAVSLGTENAAPDISDADASDMQLLCTVAAEDYRDLGGSKLATVRGLGVVVKAADASTSMYVGAITRGTPTHSADGIELRIGLLID